jgi:hypothetical protein
VFIGAVVVKSTMIQTIKPMEFCKWLMPRLLSPAKFHGPTPFVPRTFTQISMELHRYCHAPSPDYLAPTPNFRRPTPAEVLQNGRAVGPSCQKTKRQVRPIRPIVPRNYTIATQLHSIATNTYAEGEQIARHHDEFFHATTPAGRHRKLEAVHSSIDRKQRASGLYTVIGLESIA